MKPIIPHPNDGRLLGDANPPKPILPSTYTVNHQKVILQIDFKSKTLHGTSELLLNTTTSFPPEILINANQLEIREVRANGKAVAFVHRDPWNIDMEGKRDPQHHEVFRKKYLSALESSDTGELAINIDDILAMHSGTSSDSVPSVLDSITINISYIIRKPLSTLHFDFCDQHTSFAGIPQFYVDNQAHCARFWVPCVDRPQERCTWDIDIIIPRSVTDFLPSETIIAGSRWTSEELPELTALASGELVYHCIHPENDRLKIFKYSMDVPVPAASVFVAVSCFEVTEILDKDCKPTFTVLDNDATDRRVPDDDNMDVDVEGKTKLDSPGRLIVFSQPGFTGDVYHTTAFLAQAWTFFEQYTGVSYPFGSYKLLFLSDLYCPLISGAGISLLSNHFLFGESIIDQFYDTRRMLSRALASQWFGQFTFAKSCFDEWLITGLSNYVTGLFMRKHLGDNEFKYRMKMDMNRVCLMDVNQLPLCPLPPPSNAARQSKFGQKVDTEAVDPIWFQRFPHNDSWLSLRTEFVSLKAPLVIYMLDRRMGKGFLQKSISKVMVSAMSGELQLGISTQSWLKVCRKVSEKTELRQFADQWIYGSGCPKFAIKYKFNRKKMMVEVNFRQDNSNAQGIGATKKFTGPFMIRVHEPRGITYDTEITIDEIEKQHDILYHTKYKRSGQKLKKLRKLGEEMSGYQMDEDDGEDAMDSLMPEETSKGPDLDQFDRRSLDWIRWDPDNNWVCLKSYDQLRSMWIDQLTRDIDVVAQFEAIVALGKIPSDVSAAALARVLTEGRYFYRLRMEAAFSLAKCGFDDADGGGMLHLLKIYSDLHCFPRAYGSDTVVPRSNNFTNFIDYFVKKAIPTALCSARDSTGKNPLRCRKYVLDLLRYNDNESNRYSDAFFVSALISALASSFTPAMQRESIEPQPPKAASSFGASLQEYDSLVEVFDVIEKVKEDIPKKKPSELDLLSPDEKFFFFETVEEVERYLLLDRLNSSYHNVVTVCCLEAYAKWMLCGLLPTNLNQFMPYTEFGNCNFVRIIAIDSLVLLTRLQSLPTIKYLFDLVEMDPSSYIRYHVAKAMVSVSVALAANHASKTKDADADQDSSGGGGSECIPPATSDTSKKARKDFSEYELCKNIFQTPEVSSRLWNLLSASKEIRIKAYLLRLCEQLYDAYKEPIVEPPRLPKETQFDISQQPPVEALPKPKLVLRMPSTLVTQPETKIDHAPVSLKRELSEDFPLAKKPKLQKDGDQTPQTSPKDFPETPKPKPKTDLTPVTASSDKLSQSSSFVSRCTKFLTRMRNHPSSAAFVLPVDDIIAPNYSTIIKKPMDISTAQKKLESGVYKNDIGLFLEDIRLIFSNCYKYNAEGSPIYYQAKKFESHFNELLTDFQVEKESLSVKPPKTVVKLPPPISKPALSSEVFTPLPKEKIVQGYPVKDKISTPQEKPAKEKTLLTQEKPAKEKTSLTQEKPAKEKVDSEKTYKEKHTYEKSSKEKTSYEKSSQDRADQAVDLYKRCRRILKPLMLKPEGAWFLEPVDPIALNLPTYRDVIKHPMDFSTLKTRLKEGRIKSFEDFIAKGRLIFTNAMKFNTFETQVHQDALKMLKAFEAEVKASDNSSSTAIVTPKSKISDTASLSHKPLVISKPISATKPVVASKSVVAAKSDVILKPFDKKVKEELKGVTGKIATPSPSQVEKSASPIVTKKISEKATGSLSSSDMKKCTRVLKRLQQNQYGSIFLKPVDPIALGIPEYKDIIKHPMDLSTVQKKLASNKYGSSNDFKADVQLMLDNCFLFNRPDDWVYAQGKELESFFNQEWALAFDPHAKPIAAKEEETGHSDFYTIIQKLRAHPDALIFLEPVDPNMYPDYFVKIRNPIDLRGMLIKATNEEYKSIQQLESDFRLMIMNCLTYNAKHTLGYKAGLSLDKYFKKLVDPKK